MYLTYKETTGAPWCVLTFISLSCAAVSLRYVSVGGASWQCWCSSSTACSSLPTLAMRAASNTIALTRVLPEHRDNSWRHSLSRALTSWRHHCYQHQLHAAPKLPYKHYALDSSTPYPNIPAHTSTRTYRHSHVKTRSSHNIRYSTLWNTSLTTRSTTRGPSTPQQASLRASHCTNHLPKENWWLRRRSLHWL